MRDDARPTDAFSWTRPWVPYGDDPFVWYDPAEDLKKVAAPANDAQESPRPAVAAEAAAPAPTMVSRPADTSDEDIWVELPAVEDKPKRARRGRGRGRGSEPSVLTNAAAEAAAPVEAIAAPPPETVVEHAPEPANDPQPPLKKPRSRAKAKVAPVEAVTEPIATPEPISTPEPEPVAAAEPRAPDPAEISAPPAAPRKGWWRRG